MNSTNPKVSIIIPAYNVNQYIKQALLSAVNQTEKDIEVICINDGSTDNTLEIIQNVATKDPRVRIISQENSGPSAARNAGLQAALGEYVLMLDADDYLSLDAVEVAYKVAKRQQADIVNYSANIISKSPVPPWVYHSANARNIVYKDNVEECVFSESATRPFLWNKLIKLDLIRNNNIQFSENLKLGEDQAFLFNLFPLANKVVFIKDKLYNYRWRRKGSLMDSFDKKKNDSTKNHYYLIKEVFQDWYLTGNLKSFSTNILQWSTSLIYYNSISSLPHEEAVFWAKKYIKLIQFYYLDDLINFADWDKINISNYNILSFLSKCNDKKTKVSIIVNESPSHKVTECIHSVLNQSLEDIEIIFIYFSENMKNIVFGADFIEAFKDNRFKALYLPNHNFVDAKNVALTIAHADYIMFLSGYYSLSSNTVLEKLYINAVESEQTVASVGNSYFFEAPCFSSEEINQKPKQGKNIINYNDFQLDFELGNILFDKNHLLENEICFKHNDRYHGFLFIIDALANYSIVYDSDLQTLKDYQTYNTSGHFFSMHLPVVDLLESLLSVLREASSKNLLLIVKNIQRTGQELKLFDFGKSLHIDAKNVDLFSAVAGLLVFLNEKEAESKFHQIASALSDYYGNLQNVQDEEQKKFLSLKQSSAYKLGNFLAKIVHYFRR